MAAFKSELFDIQGVMDYYEAQEDVYFRVYAGNKPDEKYCRFEYLEDDKNIGMEKLHAGLQQIHESGNENQYLLQVVRKIGKKKGTVVPVEYVNIVFQLNGGRNLVPFHHGSYVGGMNIMHGNPQIQELVALNKKVIEDNNALKLQLAAAEEEDEQPQTAMGKLWADPDIKDLIIGIGKKFMGIDATFEPNVPGAIAGIPEGASQDEKIDAAIDILVKYDALLGDHLMKLAVMAQNDNAKFNMLIKMI